MRATKATGLWGNKDDDDEENGHAGKGGQRCSLKDKAPNTTAHSDDGSHEE